MADTKGTSSRGPAALPGVDLAGGAAARLGTGRHHEALDPPAGAFKSCSFCWDMSWGFSGFYMSIVINKNAMIMIIPMIT